MKDSLRQRRKRRKFSAKVLWHTPSNYIAVVDEWFGGLPLLTIVDDEYKHMNPFYSYPLNFLKNYGWVEIGEI